MGDLFISRYLNVILEVADNIIEWLSEALSISLFPKANSFAMLVILFLTTFMFWHGVNALSVWLTQRKIEWDHIKQTISALIFIMIVQDAQVKKYQGR